jgi:hypothetical protein
LRTADHHRPHAFDAEGPGVRAQRRQVAGAGRAETEVVSDQHPAHVEARDEHVVDEGRGRERRQPCVEARDERDRDAERAKELELLSQLGQAGRRAVALEELARVRVEREHRRRQPQVVGGLDEPRQHGLVPAVHAVEIADRQRHR